MKDWLGNKEADRLAGIGADAHGYTPQEIKSANEHAELVDEVQQHMVGTYIRMLKHPRVVQDRKDQKARAAEKNKQGKGRVGRPMKTPQEKGHNLRYQDGSSEYCVGCGRCTATQDRARHGFWLRNTCTPLTQFNKKLGQGHVMRMENGKWYCETCGAREKELYRPCVPRDDSGDQDSRRQADLEAANDFLSTCGEGPPRPPVFVAVENRDQGHHPQESEMQHVQECIRETGASIEAEPLERPRPGKKKVIKSSCAARTQNATNNPDILEALKSITRAQKVRTRTAVIRSSQIAACRLIIWRTLRLRRSALSLRSRNHRSLQKKVVNQLSVMSSGLENQCAVT